MKPKSLKESKAKVIAFCAGLLAAVIIMELGLRLYGWHFHRHPAPEPPLPGLKPYTVLCLGDSFTYGIGAAPEHSYPAQLARLLNSGTEAHPRYKVVNAGQLGANSSELLAALPRALEEFNPQMVIVMTGINNVWNYAGYNNYSRSRNWKTRIYDALFRLKLFKLGLLLTKNITDARERARLGESSNLTGEPGKPNPAPETLKRSTPPAADRNRTAISPLPPLDYNSVGWAFIQKRKFRQAIPWFNRAMAAGEINPDSYYGLAVAYYNLGDLKPALLWLKKYLQLNPWVAGARSQQTLKILQAGLTVMPQDPKLYYFLALVCHESYDNPAALNYARQAVKLAPGNKEYAATLARMFQVLKRDSEALDWFKRALLMDASDNDKIIASIMQIYNGSKDYEGAAAFFREAARRNPEFKDYERLARKKYRLDAAIENWLEHDMDKMIELCVDEGITFVVMQYPSGLELQSGRRSDILARTAARHSVIFIDNERLFNAVSRRADYFVPDGHCNAKGYALMAENLYLKIKAEIYEP